MKKTIINDSVIYVKSKESGSRIDYYFNRKAHDNERRGHFAIKDEKVVCNRPTQALSINVSGGFIFLSISKQIILLPIPGATILPDTLPTHWDAIIYSS